MSRQTWGWAVGVAVCVAAFVALWAHVIDRVDARWVGGGL